MEIEQRAENRHSQRAERNQSVFNFAARKISRCDAADSNSDSHGRLQVANVRFVHAQYIVAVNDDGELQQRREKEKIRITHYSPSQCAIGENGFHLRAQIADRIPLQFLVWLRRTSKGVAEPRPTAQERPG